MAMDGPAVAAGAEDRRGELPTPAEFAAVCEQHLDRVWRQLRAMGVLDGHLVDATQEVFLIAHAKLASFEGRAQLSTWLYAIAYRVGANYRRKVRRHAADELTEDQHPAGFGDPEQSLQDKRAAALVQTFCDGLSEKLRDVFVLAILEEQPAPEVAEILGVPENTVYSRVRLVREAFRRVLAESELT
jgi:RNA polymerase sigma-70 factor (ECF subfamily)